MIIIPAIDLMDGKCVRLIQGRAEDKTEYSVDPINVAKKWESKGAKMLHLVDLDGAFKGEPKNFEVVRQIVQNLNIPVEIGGGIRSVEQINQYISIGVKRVIVGTSACEDLGFSEKIFRKFGDKVIVSVDVKDGFVVKKGWVEKSPLEVIDFVRKIKDIGYQEIIYTDISKDGMLTGPNIDGCKEIINKTKIKLIVSGGISSIADIKKISEISNIGISGIITGKALYENKIKLEEALGYQNAC